MSMQEDSNLGENEAGREECSYWSEDIRVDICLKKGKKNGTEGRTQCHPRINAGGRKRTRGTVCLSVPPPKEGQSDIQAELLLDREKKDLNLVNERGILAPRESAAVYFGHTAEGEKETSGFFSRTGTISESRLEDGREAVKEFSFPSP